MARKSATLGSVLIAQDFLPEHWNWANTDLATLAILKKWEMLSKLAWKMVGAKFRKCTQ